MFLSQTTEQDDETMGLMTSTDVPFQGLTGTERESRPAVTNRNTTCIHLDKLVRGRKYLRAAGSVARGSCQKKGHQDEGESYDNEDHVADNEFAGFCTALLARTCAARCFGPRRGRLFRLAAHDCDHVYRRQQLGHCHTHRLVANLRCRRVLPSVHV